MTHRHDDYFNALERAVLRDIGSGMPRLVVDLDKLDRQRRAALVRTACA